MKKTFDIPFKRNYYPLVRFNHKQMNLYELDSLKKYLVEKGVTFAIKKSGNCLSLVGVSITKKDMFFRANGKIISKNVASLLLV